MDEEHWRRPRQVRAYQFEYLADMASSPDAVLRAFILDYCSKKGLHAAAAGLRADVQSKGEPNITLPGVLVSPQNSFLSEWYGPLLSLLFSYLMSVVLDR